MAPSIFQRHPRFSIACGVGVLVIFLLQLSGPPEGMASNFGRLYPPAPPGTVDVTWKLKKSEQTYQNMIRQVSGARQDPHVARLMKWHVASAIDQAIRSYQGRHLAVCTGRQPPA